ncbi:MAG TPA: hypothetical protein VLF20_00590 [Patescibacteria group bacterium]|nr:hypothetical protein [Patescibacteria group bacterium]
MPVIREVYLGKRRIVSRSFTTRPPETLRSVESSDLGVFERRLRVRVIDADTLSVVETATNPLTRRPSLCFYNHYQRAINDFHIEGYPGRLGQRVVYRWEAASS